MKPPSKQWNTDTKTTKNLRVWYKSCLAWSQKS